MQTIAFQNGRAVYSSAVGKQLPSAHKGRDQKNDGAGLGAGDEAGRDDAAAAEVEADGE